jgi:preprotein translocase subunit SecB
MTDVAGPTSETGQDQGGPFFQILAQFVRDLSFENPRAPESLRLEGKPDVELGVEMSARGRTDGLFEVDMRLNIKASAADAALFQIDLTYGGLFRIGGVEEDQLEQMLLIECPRYLFPFARQIVSACSADGGFYPPFLMEPIDFAAIYAARKSQGADYQPMGQA